MSNKKLTVIIPFLNEKCEVENTLESIKIHSNNDIEIILINDASDDGFDYKSVVEKYNVIYIENTERMGVAASRDLGVKVCQTPYFLLLDAHMRFYDNSWVKRIIEELEKDKRTLLCCQTKILRLENDIVAVDPKDFPSHGAYIELYNGEEGLLIEPFWILQESAGSSHLQSIPIPCVFGAGYACSKDYWQYLKGLEGLKYWGCDEPYISLKVWLEGGSCKLLKDVVIGHIYCSFADHPYEIDMMYRLYNRLLIIELLFPEIYKKELISQLRRFHYDYLSESLLILYENRKTVNRLKNYYQQIFTRDFSFFEKLNNQCYKNNRVVENPNTILRDIAARAETEFIPDIGIWKGRMGVVIFLFHYAQYSNNDLYKDLAENMLTDIFNDIRKDTHYGFATGISGIGWGIEYLFQQGFIEGDTNEILSDFDKRIMEIDPKRIVDLNKDYGLGGIVLYLLARLFSIKKEKKENPFDSEYLSSVYNRIRSVIEQKDATCDSVGFFIEFLDYYQDKKTIDQPEIYDVWCLLNPQNIPLKDLELGLPGVSGIGIKLILENERDALKN